MTIAVVVWHITLDKLNAFAERPRAIYICNRFEIKKSSLIRYKKVYDAKVTLVIVIAVHFP